jgi:hypothetical protein
MEKIIDKFLTARRVSPQDEHCFCGYFDKCPWDESGRYLLVHRIDFNNRQPVPGDYADILLLNLKENNSRKIASSNAFCWQQGSMLQWLNKNEIIFNDKIEGHFASRIINIETGHESALPRPIYCLSKDSRHALSVNFARLDRERPGYGYSDSVDNYAPHSEEDGIYLMDMETQKSSLIISYDKIVKEFNLPEMNGRMNWFNHLLFNPSGNRFAFLHRWRLKSGRHRTHMLTANIDGSDIYMLNPDEMSSHYTWMNDEKIICYSRRQNFGDHYYIYKDGTQDVEIVGEKLFNQDGHCSFSANMKWMLTDTYPSSDTNYSSALILYDYPADIRYNIGLFKSDSNLPLPARCDLHPKWSRENKYVCIDSLHEGFRGVYVIDVSELLLEDSLQP